MSKKDINIYSIVAIVMVSISGAGFYLGDVLIDTSALDTATTSLERIVFGLLTVTSILSLIFGSFAMYKSPTWVAKTLLSVVLIAGIAALVLNGVTFLLSGFVVSY